MSRSPRPTSSRSRSWRRSGTRPIPTRAFEQAGGKLILWQGEADWSIPTITSIAYYQAVVKAKGGLAHQQFARYYLLPSVGHCGGNGPDTYNGLGAVVPWAEKHMLPERARSRRSTRRPPAHRRRRPGAWPPAGQRPDRRRSGARRSRTTAVVRTLPLFPYPELPAYKGTAMSTTPPATYGQGQQGPAGADPMAREVRHDPRCGATAKARGAGSTGASAGRGRGITVTAGRR